MADLTVRAGIKSKQGNPNTIMRCCRELVNQSRSGTRHIDWDQLRAKTTYRNYNEFIKFTLETLNISSLNTAFKTRIISHLEQLGVRTNYSSGNTITQINTWSSDHLKQYHDEQLNHSSNKQQPLHFSHRNTLVAQAALSITVSTTIPQQRVVKLPIGSTPIQFPSKDSPHRHSEDALIQHIKHLPNELAKKLLNWVNQTKHNPSHVKVAHIHFEISSKFKACDTCTNLLQQELLSITPHSALTMILNGFKSYKFVSTTPIGADITFMYSFAPKTLKSDKNSYDQPTVHQPKQRVVERFHDQVFTQHAHSFLKDPSAKINQPSSLPTLFISGQSNEYEQSYIREILRRSIEQTSFQKALKEWEFVREGEHVDDPLDCQLGPHHIHIPFYIKNKHQPMFEGRPNELVVGSTCVLKFKINPKGVELSDENRETYIRRLTNGTVHRHLAFLNKLTKERHIITFYQQTQTISFNDLITVSTAFHNQSEIKRPLKLFLNGPLTLSEAKLKTAAELESVQKFLQKSDKAVINKAIKNRIKNAETALSTICNRLNKRSLASNYMKQKKLTPKQFNLILNLNDRFGRKASKLERQQLSFLKVKKTGLLDLKPYQLRSIFPYLSLSNQIHTQQSVNQTKKRKRD